MRGIRGTKCGECGERGACSLGFLGNLLGDSGECYCFNIPGNLEEVSWEDSGECSRTFRGIFNNVPGMLRKIPGNEY